MTEQQLRKALGAANDLEPPTDELFTQRALQRGRARTARRRNAILGAAAGLALVGVIGGGTLLMDRTSLDSTVSGAQAERDQGSAQDSAGGSAGGGGTPGAGLAPTGQVMSAGDTSAWIAGRETPQRSALDELAPTLALNYPDVFGGAYATDATNTRIVVTVTRRDAGLESLVTAAMPAPTDVTFELVANTAIRKQEIARRVAEDASGWLAKGYPVLGVRLDARSDRVVVTVGEPEAVDVIEARYGPDVVRAEVGVGPPLGGTVTEGPTLPTPQR